MAEVTAAAARVLVAMVAAAMMVVERVAAATGVVKEAVVRVMVRVCHWRQGMSSTVRTLLEHLC